MEAKPVRVSAHQPNFLPWVGFWHKFLSADVFVICTGTKYTKKSYGNRVIMADNYSWATIPTARGGLLYKDVKISDPKAVSQLGRRVRQWSKQRKYVYRERITPIIDRLLSNETNRLSDLNIDLIKLIIEQIGDCENKIIIDNSEWFGENTADKIQRLIGSHGNQYLAGASTLGYLGRVDLPNISEVFIQKIVPDCPKESILHALATEKDVQDYILTKGDWTKWSDF